MGNLRTLKRREQRKKVMFGTPSIAYNSFSIPMSNLVANQCNAPCGGPTSPVAKKGKPMYDCYDCCEQPSHENRQLSYFQNRVDSIQYTKRTELRKMFNLDDDAAPTTGQELLDRITAGSYILCTAEEMKNSYYSHLATSWFRWKNPAAKEDQAGFDKAETELRKLSNKTTDIVTVGDSAQILAAIDALEAFVPSNAPAAV